jgi:hypothetical protein
MTDKRVLKETLKISFIHPRKEKKYINIKNILIEKFILLLINFQALQRRNVVYTFFYNFLIWIHF